MINARWTHRVLLAALLLASVGLASSTRTSPRITPEVFVFPESLMVAEGSNFQLEIFITSDITGLKGYDVAVTFNSTIIQIQNVTEGTLPSTSGHPTFFSWLNPADPDSVHVNGAILGNVVDGPGALFVLHFMAPDFNEDKETDINIVFTDLRDFDNESITHTVVDGWVRVLDTVPTEQTTWGEIKKKYQ